MEFDRMTDMFMTVWNVFAEREADEEEYRRVEEWWGVLER